MPDEIQNPIPEENSIPASPQEPMADISINTIGSEPLNMPPEPLESPKNTDIPVSLNNPNPENTPILIPSPEEAIPLEPTDIGANPAFNGTSEPSAESTPETGTAQIPVNESFDPAQNKPLASEPEPIQTQTSQPKSSLARQLLITARNAIQFRKRKKLDKIMALFLQQSKITNNEVEKFLHVSDATAERYLNTLEKENRIRQVGKTGKAVSYFRI